MGRRPGLGDRPLRRPWLQVSAKRYMPSPEAERKGHRSVGARVLSSLLRESVRIVSHSAWSVALSALSHSFVQEHLLEMDCTSVLLPIDPAGGHNLKTHQPSPHHKHLMNIHVVDSGRSEDTSDASDDVSSSVDGPGGGRGMDPSPGSPPASRGAFSYLPSPRLLDCHTRPNGHVWRSNRGSLLN